MAVGVLHSSWKINADTADRRPGKDKRQFHDPDPGRTSVICAPMKQTLLSLAAGCCLFTAMAQTPVTVSTGAANAEQIWYSLLNGEVGAAALAEWDLAFEMTGLTAGIRVNTAKGLTVYRTDVGIDDWDALTAPDEASWTAIYNDPTRWDFGALNDGNNMDQPDGLDLGWGLYNMGNHQMIGNRVFAIKKADETWMKLRINSVISGVFSFTYANIDGSDSHDASFNKTAFAGKNFAYWSFSSHTALDREPLNTSWDLLFTKYTDFVPTAYNVAGVLQNRLVTAMQVDGVPNDQAQWSPGQMTSDMNVLGADWKRDDFAAGAYVIAPDTTYFVKDRPGNIWKIIFTGYGGGANGNMSFTQELVSSVGVGEQAAHGQVAVYPNPVAGGRATLVLDLPAARASVRVFNNAGQQVMETSVDGLRGLTIRELDVRQLSPGLYVLRVETPGGLATGKLVIE